MYKHCRPIQEDSKTVHRWNKKGMVGKKRLCLLLKKKNWEGRTPWVNAPGCHQRVTSLPIKITQTITKYGYLNTTMKQRGITHFYKTTLLKKERRAITIQLFFFSRHLATIVISENLRCRCHLQFGPVFFSSHFAKFSSDAWKVNVYNVSTLNRKPEIIIFDKVKKFSISEVFSHKVLLKLFQLANSTNNPTTRTLWIVKLSKTKLRWVQMHPLTDHWKWVEKE